MHPESMRQQNSQRVSDQPGASTRNSFQRVQRGTIVTTEYQERFLPPSCHTALVSTSTKKGPYHPLKATSTDVATFKSYYVTHKWIQNPPRAPQPSVPAVPSIQHKRGGSAPRNPLHYLETQAAPRLEDKTSVYKADFQAWKTSKRQPFKLKDSLKVKFGLAVTQSASQEGRSLQVADDSKEVPQAQEPEPIESITSYRSDYVPYALEPWTRRDKPRYQTTKDLLSEPEVPSRTKVKQDINKNLFGEASDFLQQFKSWSLETKIQSQGKARDPGPPADHRFLSMTQAECTAHQRQRAQPALPVKTRQKTTTINEDYRAWDTWRRFPAEHKEKQRQPRKTDSSVCTPKPPDSCKTNPQPSRLHPKLNETEQARCSNCNATKKPQRPAEDGATSGFEHIPNGTEESRRFWMASVDGGTWADGGTCEEPSEAHQMISCMVSSRS